MCKLPFVIWVGKVNVDAIFNPVTWWGSEASPLPAPWPTKQERPTGGWPAGSPPTIKSVKCLYEEGRPERESERERAQIPFKWFFVLPFYTHVCHMPILPLPSTKLYVDAWFLLWLDLTGFINIEGFLRPRSLSGTNPFRCPKSHLEGKSGPTLDRGGIFLNSKCLILSKCCS